MRPHPEIEIKNYIRIVSRDGNKLNIPMSKIAKDTGFSVATVHRVIKKLEATDVIRVVKSRAKAKPDTIIIQDRSEDILTIAHELLEKSKSVTLLSQELIRRFCEKQRELDRANKIISEYEEK